MKLQEINEEVFNEFVKNQKTANFFQSIEMIAKHQINNEEFYILGLYKEELLVAATIITKTHQFLKKKVFTALRGFITDFNNNEVVETFTKEILRFIKKQGGFRLIIEPYLPYISRDTNGEQTSDIDNSSIKENLIKIGYKEVPTHNVKWVYCVDTDKNSEKLFKDLKPNTRNYLNKTKNKFQLEIKELSYDELPLFKKITESASTKNKFKDRSLGYYQNMFKCFQDKISYKVAVLNYDKYLKVLETELSTSKEKNFLLEKIEQVKKEQKEYGNEVILAGAMFIIHGDEIVYLFSGSHESHLHYFGQYLLQWHMIEYASNNKFKRYNFYGISGNFEKGSPGYGVYEFKKSFGGYVEELLGGFEIDSSPFGIIYNLAKKIKNLIK